MEFLKTMSKQVIAAVVVLGIAFFFWPGFTIPLAIGFVAGMIVGNLVPAVEALAEKAIAKFKK